MYDTGRSLIRFLQLHLLIDWRSLLSHQSFFDYIIKYGDIFHLSFRNKTFTNWLIAQSWIITTVRAIAVKYIREQIIKFLQLLLQIDLRSLLNHQSFVDQRFSIVPFGVLLTVFRTYPVMPRGFWFE